MKHLFLAVAAALSLAALAPMTAHAGDGKKLFKGQAE